MGNGFIGRREKKGSFIYFLIIYVLQDNIEGLSIALQEEKKNID